MSQTVEAKEFLQRLSHRDISLQSVLKPSLEDETTLRRLFATDRENARLKDTHVGLVDIFGKDAHVARRSRPAASKLNDQDHYVMPLTDGERKKSGEPVLVSSIDEFRDHWDVFTNNSLKSLTNWSNVVAAGGSILACAMPDDKSSKDIAKSYDKQYPGSDVDLFLWGLTPEEAEKRANDIYIVIRNASSKGCTCVRTTHAISIHTQYPTRTVQVILRLYHSPAEVLAGFDIDSACFAYDGQRLWANPRAVVAVMSQCNTVDLTRRSPSYEFRLEKYRSRRFEVYVPQLQREGVHDKIYSRRISEVQGLARLLLLEKLRDPGFRQGYFLELTDADQWSSPARTRFFARLRYRRERGDRRARGYHMAGAADYDSAYQVPYGPKYTNQAIRVDLERHENRLLERNRGQDIHQHFAFWGTMRDCVEGRCHSCPAPQNEAEMELQKKNDEYSVRGHVQFMLNDPGRQSISGSFHPIDDGDWYNQAYEGSANAPEKRNDGSASGHNAESGTSGNDVIRAQDTNDDADAPRTKAFKRFKDQVIPTAFRSVIRKSKLLMSDSQGILRTTR